MAPRIAMCACGASRFCGSLDVVAEVAAQVLDQPVKQRGKVDRISRSPLIVVGHRIDGGAVVGDLAVTVEGEREEH